MNIDLHSIDLHSVVLVLVVASIVFLGTFIRAGLKNRKRIEAHRLDDEMRLAERIQAQQTEIEMLKQQLAESKYRQITLAEDEVMSRRTRHAYPRCESTGLHERTAAEIAQRDDLLEDFASER